MDTQQYLKNFTLVVDDFGAKYSEKEHALHLKAEMKDKYKVATDWEGRIYICNINTVGL